MDAISDGSSDGSESPVSTPRLTRYATIDQTAVHTEFKVPEKLTFSKVVTNVATAQGLRTNLSKLKALATDNTPLFEWARGYNRSMAIEDCMAGITVGVLLIPTGIAYAGLAGQPPITGLLTAFFPALLYALLGTSRQMSVGPEVISSVLIGQFVGHQADTMGITDPGQIFAIAQTLSFLVGVVLMVMGLFKFGFIQTILARSVVSALIMGVCTEILIGQMRNMFQFPVAHDKEERPFSELWFYLNNLGTIQAVATGVTFCSLFWLYLFKYLTEKYPKLRYFPSVLVVVLVTNLISRAANWSGNNVRVLGNINGGFVAPAMINLNLDLVSTLFGDAATIAILLFVESFVVAKQYSEKHTYNVSPNRELVAFGFANLISPFFGCYVGAGSLPRSKLNDSAGAKTPMSQVACAFVVMLAILFLLPFFSTLPKACTASVVFYVVGNLLEVHDVQFMWRVRAYGELALYAMMYFATLLFGVNNSIMLAFVVCLARLVKNVAVSQPELVVLGYYERSGKFVALERHQSAQLIEGITFLRVAGALHFVNIGRIKELFMKMEQLSHLQKSARIVFDMENVPSIDTSALEVFISLLEYTHEHGYEVYMVGCSDALMHLFQLSGLSARMGPDHVMDSSLGDVYLSLLPKTTETVAEVADHEHTVEVAEPSMSETEPSGTLEYKQEQLEPSGTLEYKQEQLEPVDPGLAPLSMEQPTTQPY